MKKRFKLIGSIISVCICLAALCFGVWAATGVQMTLSGSIAYEVNEVFVKVETKLYRSTAVTGITDEQISTDIAGFSSTLSQTVELVDGFEMADVVTYDPETGISDAGELVSKSVENVDLTYGPYSETNTSGYAFYFVFNITNYGTNAINVQVTNNSDSELLTNNKVLGLAPSVISGKGSAESVTTAKVIAMSPADMMTGFAAIDYNFTISINNGILSGVLIENTASQYYGMYMGSYNGTPIEWRLISTDGGQSSYTFASGQAETITGDCVFIQNTYTKNMAFNSSSSYKQATDDDATNYPGITSGNYYLLDDSGNYIVLSETTEGDVTTKEYALANNYEYSEIREYITGDMITDLGLTDDETYAKIQANTDVYNDKFYLLSETEANSLFSSAENRKFYNGSSATNYWLRSPSSSSAVSANFVLSYGNTYYYSVGNGSGVRAAFKIAL